MSQLTYDSEETMRQIKRDWLISGEGWKWCEQCDGTGIHKDKRLRPSVIE